MEWVNVKKEWPQEDFIAYWSDGQYTILDYDKDYVDYAILHHPNSRITHWMPLPEAPKD